MAVRIRKLTPGEAWDAAVQPLREALSDERGGVAAVQTHMRLVLQTGAWRHYIDPAGEEQRPRSFAEFVTAKPFRGIGAENTEQVRAMLTDAKLRDAFDKAVQRKGGRPGKTFDNIQGFPAPTGTSESAALRRLRKDRPDLHAEVLAGRMSAHAAMVQAGFRPRTITVPVTRPESVARALRAHMPPGDIATLIDLLIEPDAPDKPGGKK